MNGVGAWWYQGIGPAGGATDLVIQDALHGHAADNITIIVDPTLVIADALHAHAADGLQQNPGRSDVFDESSGTWAGKAADLGGNWIEETAATGAADTVTGSVAQVVHSSPGDSANSQNMRLDGDLENVVSLVKLRVDKNPTGDAISMNIPMRKQSGLNELYRAGMRFETTGNVTLRLEAAAPGTVFASVDLGTYTANDWWWLKSYLRTLPSGGGVVYFAKAWKDGTSEPAGWQLSHLDQNATYMHGPGTVGLRSFTPTTASNFPYTFQFDDFDVKVNQELSQVHILVIADALHGHAADNLTLEAGSVDLVIQEALHSHAADNLVLTQVHELVIQEALHGHAADNLGLTQVHELVVQEALHGHTAENLDLTQGHVLVIQDALHGHQADNLVLTQIHVLQIADALHGHAADNLTLTVPGGAPAAEQHYYSMRRRRGLVGANRRG